jgi:hypothetical protein
MVGVMRLVALALVVNFALTAEALYTIDPLPDKKTWSVLRASLR